MKKSNFYTLPLRLSENNIYIYCENGIKAFNLLNSSSKYMWIVRQVVDKLNGDDIDFDIIFDIEDNKYIVNSGNGERLLKVRGWGDLTSISKFGLSDTDAANEQQIFLKWCVNRLNN